MTVQGSLPSEGPSVPPTGEPSGSPVVPPTGSPIVSESAKPTGTPSEPVSTTKVTMSMDMPDLTGEIPPLARPRFRDCQRR